MKKNNYKFLVAGQEGMVGSEIYNILKKKKKNIIECKRKDLDFTNYKAVLKFFKKKKPNVVINAAGKVGGILDNSKYPIDYLNVNLAIGFNILNISDKCNVKKVINIGSACIYPKETRLPIKEEYLLSSYLEKTNEAYALAKITTLKLCEYYKKFKNKDFISVQPANLYGVNDNFNLKSSHVIPALIRKFYEAKKRNDKFVKIWGNGKNMREFLYVDDLANAIIKLIDKKNKFTYINIGSGEEVSIKELAKIIKTISKFKGHLFFDKKMPGGQKRRILSSKKIKSLAWKPLVSLKKGLELVYNFYEKKQIKADNKSGFSRSR